MKNIKLCMGVGPKFGINVCEQIHLLKKSGLMAFFPHGMKILLIMLNWQKKMV